MLQSQVRFLNGGCVSSGARDIRSTERACSAQGSHESIGLGLVFLTVALGGIIRTDGKDKAQRGEAICT